MSEELNIACDAASIRRMLTHLGTRIVDAEHDYQSQLAGEHDSWDEVYDGAIAAAVSNLTVASREVALAVGGLKAAGRARGKNPPPREPVESAWRT